MDRNKEIGDFSFDEDILGDYQEFCFSEKLLQTPEQLLFKSIVFKDKHTAIHCLNVANYSRCLGQEIGLSRSQMLALCKAALFHDIGKIRVPNWILNKEGSLTNDEWWVMKKHPSFGEEMLKNLTTDFDSSISNIVRHHHENYCGSGYPDGLEGEKIPLASRIIAVADIFDALTSDRPYRKAYSIYEAVYIIKNECESKLDPYLANLFMDKVIKINREVLLDSRNRGRFLAL